jgi:N-acetylglucosaminyl-diphospho-decaprenol L-rhamnosyltransferase
MVHDRQCTYELVVVSYHSRKPLCRLLDAVDGVPVVVVDNAANVDGIKDVTSTRTAVRYVDARENVGFAGAANLGAAVSEADVVIFVNPDCLPTRAVMDQLASTVSSHPDIASCSPALRDVDGRLSRLGGGWAPTVTRCLVHAIGAHLLLRQAGIWFAPRGGEVQEVGWLAGTCLAVRRSTFQAVRGFDERYFLYNEDMALGDRIRRHGMRQIFRADLAVEHLGGGSSAVPPVGLWLLRAGSLGRYIDDHNNAASAVCMRAILGAGSLVRAAAFSFTAGRRHRRREMLTYFAGILRPRRATAIAVTSLSASTAHHGKGRA